MILIIVTRTSKIYRSLNATVAQSKKFPCEADKQIEHKNVTTLPKNYGICFDWEVFRYCGWSCYVFELKCSIISNWLFL